MDRKVACKYNEYKSHSALDNHVKNETLSNGYYYMLYEKCEKSLREDFENKYGIPILYKNGIGQYDINGNLLKEFVCKYDCSKILKIGDKSLTKSLDKNMIYDNHYYKYLGYKEKIL